MERKYASPLKRAFLPLYDAIAVLAGFYAIYSGIPSLDALVPQMVSTIVGFLFITAAFVALAGIAFPAAWRLEIAGKLVLFGILGTYLIAWVVLSRWRCWFLCCACGCWARRSVSAERMMPDADS
jgi:hypothetical protein